MKKDNAPIFQSRVGQFTKEIKEVNGLLDRIAWIRLGVFIAFIVSLLVTWGSVPVALSLIGAVFVAFGVLVKWNQRVNNRKDFLVRLRQINEDELRRLKVDLDGMDGGEEFTEPTHPYSSDLDLFGKHSLFQLISHASTLFGRRILASWMKAPADRATILQRQTAIKELSEQIDWRQAFEAEGGVFEDTGVTVEELRDWLHEEPFLKNNPKYKYAALFLGTLVFAGVGLAIAGLITFWAPVGVAIVNAAFNFSLGKFSHSVYEATDRKARLLASYASLIEKIQALNPDSDLLKGFQDRLSSGSEDAASEIRRLSFIFAQLEVRLNGLPYLILNNLFFWDIIWIQKLEKWKLKLRDHLMDWFAVIGEAEAINSLSSSYYLSEYWIIPEIPDSELIVSGQNLGHPMLAPEGRVDNPIDIQKKGRIWLITGSNMSGKSTYLRTVGANLVLALCGGPVVADSLQVTPLHLASSMRAIDSLEESTSSFYAELKRLKTVIRMTEELPATFFLLDEILKGTNSRDRHTGSRALIRQLHESGGAGLVSTHDLDLQNFEEELKGEVINYSFHCEVKPDEKLFFDYSIRTGVCQSMNASQLMQQMGIRMGLPETSE